MHEQLDTDSARRLIEKQTWTEPKRFQPGDRVFIRSIEQTGVLLSTWSTGATIQIDGPQNRRDVFRFDDLELRPRSIVTSAESFPPWTDAWDPAVTLNHQPSTIKRKSRVPSGRVIFVGIIALCILFELLTWAFSS